MYFSAQREPVRRQKMEIILMALEVVRKTGLFMATFSIQFEFDAFEGAYPYGNAFVLPRLELPFGNGPFGFAGYARMGRLVDFQGLHTTVPANHYFHPQGAAGSRGARDLGELQGRHAQFPRSLLHFAFAENHDFHVLAAYAHSGPSRNGQVRLEFEGLGFEGGG